LFSASKKPEDVNVICDHYTALSTVIEYRGCIEMAVKGAEGIGSAHDGGVNDRVILRVGRHDTGSRAGENNL
jgi:hypothetical protein